MAYLCYDPQKETVEEFSQRVMAIARELSPSYPDVDATDLVHIVEGKLRKFGTGKEWLLRVRPEGGYVF